MFVLKVQRQKVIQVHLGQRLCPCATTIVLARSLSKQESLVYVYQCCYNKRCIELHLAVANAHDRAAEHGLDQLQAQERVYLELSFSSQSSLLAFGRAQAALGEARWGARAEAARRATSARRGLINATFA